MSPIKENKGLEQFQRGKDVEHPADATDSVHTAGGSDSISSSSSTCQRIQRNNSWKWSLREKFVDDHSSGRFSDRSQWNNPGVSFRVGFDQHGTSRKKKKNSGKAESVKLLGKKAQEAPPPHPQKERAVP